MGAPLKVRETPIGGVVRVDVEPQADARGTFARLFCSLELGTILGSRTIVQINHSLTRAAGAVRGLHFQRPPHAEMKLVRCLRGRIWDVALDLRAGSPTFLEWHAEELSGTNARMLVIPEGCAHGFQALEDNCELLYLHTSPYAPSAEGGVRPDDPRLALPWPLPLRELSERDRRHPPLGPDFAGLPQ